jgi:hypothetical protein
MITFQRETLFDVIEDIDHLLKIHHEEVSPYRVEIDPMWSDYAVLERMGRYVLFTARCDGVLVGYAAFFFNKHFHHAGLTVAISDVLFLHPEHRKGTGAGIGLIKFSEFELKKIGATNINWHVPEHLSAVMRHLGYDRLEAVYGKNL